MPSSVVIIWFPCDYFQSVWLGNKQVVSANSIEAESWSNHRKDSSFMLHRIGRLERFSFRRAKSSSIAVLYRKECRGRRLEKERGLGQYEKKYI